MQDGCSHGNEEEKRIGNILVNEVNQSWTLANGLMRNKVFLGHRRDRELNHKNMLFYGKKRSNIINFT